MALRENGGQTPKRATKVPRTVVIIHSNELVRLCDNLPKVPNRVSGFFFSTSIVLFVDFATKSFPLTLLHNYFSYFVII